MDSQSSDLHSPKNGKGRLIFIALLLISGIVGAWFAYQMMGEPSQDKPVAPVADRPQDGMHVAIEAQGQSFVRSLDEGKMPDTDAAFEQIREQMTKSSADGDDAEKAVAMVTSGYLEVVQELTNEHKASLRKLMDANVFAFELKDREMIAAHKALILEFIDTNTNLVVTITERENAMRAGLEETDLTPEEIDKIAVDISNTAERTAETELLIRGCDQALADSALKILDLLDKNWDKLSQDEATGNADGSQSELWKMIGDEIIAIKKISDYQIAIQKHFFGPAAQSTEGQ